MKLIRWTIVVVVLVVVGRYFVLPGLMRARQAGNQTVARSTLLEIATAEVAFAVSCGNGGFTSSFRVLGELQGSGSQNLAALETAEKSGYRFSLAPGSAASNGPVDCRGRPTYTAWYAAATPVTPLGLDFSFATSNHGAIWYTTDGPAPSEPFGPPARRIE